MPPAFAALTRPALMADMGQAFSTLECQISSLALPASSFAGRLIAGHVAKHAGKPSYAANLVSNMVNKRKERLDERRRIDEMLCQLLTNT